MNALFAPQRTTERVEQRRNSSALAIAADDVEGLTPLSLACASREQHQQQRRQQRVRELRHFQIR